MADALGRRSPARLAELLEDLQLPPSGDPEVALDRLAAHLGDAAVLRGLLERAPDGVRPLLDRLTWGPPVGQVTDADRPVRAAGARGPVEWLLAHGLLAVAGPGRVVLPREVGLALRGGRVHREPAVAPPPLEGRNRPRRSIDNAAAGAADEAVRLVEALGELWGAAPPPVLRGGGVGVRELRRSATVLEVPEPVAALVIELAWLAGLVADDGEADPRWAPTADFDHWRAAGLGVRWARLAAAWLDTTRAPALVGSRDARDTPRVPLGPDLDRAGTPEVRHWYLDTLAAVADSPDGPLGADPESLRARLDWASPLRASRGRDAVLGWAADEAAWLGVTGLGALSSFGRTLLRDPASAGAQLEEALPPAAGEILLQADLTAVAPGRLVPALARELALLADVESRGGATVYRFGESSVRRALDVGRSAEDLLTLLTSHSRTPVPQPLEYLIRDTARRHGRIRVGAAGCYLRADDDAVLTELLADRRAAKLRLRRLAPGVLVSPAAPQAVLGALRDLGLAPAAESEGGELLLRPPDVHRAPDRQRPQPVRTLPPPLATATLDALVRALRAVDNAGPGTAGNGTAGAVLGLPGDTRFPVTDPVAVLAAVRSAVADRTPLSLGYVDAEGRAWRRVVEPVTVDGGRIVVLDRESEELLTISVHRISGVRPARDAAQDG
jgi:hypothetical protein